jgi:hypothetical protein
MASKANILRFDHLTYRGNSKDTRYGWLRLTPAFSVHLVQEFLRELPSHARVLDPFCGTGTTALVCAEEGVQCLSTDINPFLLWLSEAKCAAYSKEDVETAQFVAGIVSAALRGQGTKAFWAPPLHQIEKWWEPPILDLLGRARATIEEQSECIPHGATTLLKIAFCRTMIELAKVSFGHQSMSFKKTTPTLLLDLNLDATEAVVAKWNQSIRSIVSAARTELAAQPLFIRCDARRLGAELPHDFFDCVITSPPYPNRMSYIRELRPYMYWLGYLSNGRDAGELDWEAIGGTWGCATSNLMKWTPPQGITVPYRGFPSILSRVAESSPLLSRYVHKYFCDMALHVESLSKVVRSGAVIHYVIGNSKFYDVLLPAEAILASLFTNSGFGETRVHVIRKRTSKKELFEYVVSARKL